MASLFEQHIVEKLNNGGSAIPGGMVKTGTASPIIVTRLTNGSAYKCKKWYEQPQKKTYYPKDERDKMREASGGKCEYCGKPTQNDVPFQPDSRVGEHFDPQANGGQTTPENHVHSCQECNLGKSDKIPGKNWNPKNPNDRVKK